MSFIGKVKGETSGERAAVFVLFVEKTHSRRRLVALPDCSGAVPQSRKATFAMVRGAVSVFIKTRCHSCRVIVA
jgi:hypothetical protein